MQTSPNYNPKMVKKKKKKNHFNKIYKIMFNETSPQILLQSPDYTSLGTCMVIHNTINVCVRRGSHNHKLVCLCVAYNLTKHLGSCSWLCTRGSCSSTITRSQLMCLCGCVIVIICDFIKDIFVHFF